MFLYVHAHNFQYRSQNNVIRTVSTIIILVYVTAYYFYIASFFSSSKYTVSRTACSYEQNITALIDESFSNNFTGCFICKASNIVSTYIFIGNVNACVRWDLYDLNTGIIFLICVIDTTLKTVLIVYIAWVCNTGYYSYLFAFRLQCSCHSREETSFLLLESHCINIITFDVITLRIGRIRIYKDKIYIWVIGCDGSDSGELEARAYDHIVVCNDISNCLNNCSRITGFLANRSYGCSRMRLDKFQDTVVVILVKGAVIYTGWTGHDGDL